jgi:hypothetical protein
MALKKIAMRFYQKILRGETTLIHYQAAKSYD